MPLNTLKETGDLWAQFFDCRKISVLNKQEFAAIREKLIINYLPLVRNIAGRLAVKVPFFLQQDDLESCGIIGLMEAVDKFDPDLGVAFESFAYHRIRGAMLDELRRQNWLPRTVWQKQQLIKSAHLKLQQNGQEVTEKALVKATGISLPELREITSPVNSGQVYSLDEDVYSTEGDAVRRGDLVEGPDSFEPLEEISKAEDAKILAVAVEALNKREKLILALYYQEKLTLKEIGKVLAVSESRVCQLHSQAIKRLKKALKG
ncbi:MAG: FliA/WhiG family RNA polymerase sigma factor [Desulfotomaculum sp.]|nr:FliA/WhiG family RNA polymerase sigma factor [Desulfotomaculum sp.]